MPGKRRCAAPEDGLAAKRSNTAGDASLQMRRAWVQIVLEKMMSMLHPAEGSAEGSVEIHPGQWALDNFGTAEAGALNRAALRDACERLLGSPIIVLDDSIEFPLTGTEATVELPLDAYVLERIRMAGVVDLPKSSQWENFFHDILAENFDSSREPLRGFKHLKDGGATVTPGSVDLQRGFTRVSILYFISHWGCYAFQQQQRLEDQVGELESFRACHAITTPFPV